MDDLVARVDLADRELMNEIRTRLGPGASITAVLDAARDVNMKRYAHQLVLHNCETIFTMVEYIHDLWELNVDDTRAVLTHVHALTGDEALGRFIGSGLIDSVWKYTHLEPEPVKGCFTWARSLHRRPCRSRRPCRLRFPSPDTGTAGTGQ